MIKPDNKNGNYYEKNFKCLGTISNSYKHPVLGDRLAYLNYNNDLNFWIIKFLNNLIYESLLLILNKSFSKSELHYLNSLNIIKYKWTIQKYEYILIIIIYK